LVGIEGWRVCAAEESEETDARDDGTDKLALEVSAERVAGVNDEPSTERAALV
jgi:hypothetical protein